MEKEEFYRKFMGECRRTMGEDFDRIGEEYYGDITNRIYSEVRHLRIDDQRIERLAGGLKRSLERSLSQNNLNR